MDGGLPKTLVGHEWGWHGFREFLEERPWEVPEGERSGGDPK